MIDSTTAAALGEVGIFALVLLVVVMFMRPLLGALINSYKELMAVSRQSAEANERSARTNEASAEALKALTREIDSATNDLRAALNTSQVATKGVIADAQKNAEKFAQEETAKAQKAVLDAMTTGFGSVEQQIKSLRDDLGKHRTNDGAVIQKLDAVLGDLGRIKELISPPGGAEVAVAAVSAAPGALTPSGPTPAA
jgi:F0F1-type ATP synthase membrane subunit b/b'